MNAEKTVATIPAKLSEDEVNEILLPDLSKDKFKLGTKEFSIRILPWRWELDFRRFALPILTEEMKPFERALQVFKTNAGLLAMELGIAAATGKSEVEGDKYLNNAVIIICVSQDPKIRSAAAKGEELTDVDVANIERKYRVMLNNLERPDGDNRNFLREIVRVQMEKMHMLQKLGESLMARFADIARLAGMSESEVHSLKRDFTQQVRSFMAKAGNTEGIPANSSSQSTASGSESTPSEKNLKSMSQPEVEADPEEELHEQRERERQTVES